MKIQVEIPEIGSKVSYGGRTYEILTTATFQENDGEKVQMTTFATCLELTDNGEDAGKAAISLRDDLYTEI